MLPLSTVESASFHKMIQTFVPGIKVMCTETLKNRLEERKNKLVFNLREHLRKVDQVCTTADIWTHHQCSFLGVTCHWLEENTLARKSAVLTIKPFTGSHTYDRIAEELSAIHTYYDLDTCKITHTVTDNGSNFKKAFREYSSQEMDTEITMEEDFEEGLEFIDVGSILQNETSDVDCDIVSQVIYLPNHISCLSHTLNLICTSDVKEAVKSCPKYKKIYNGVQGKCTALSNAVHRSSLAYEAIQEIAGCTIPKPGTTRWNSTYESWAKILKIKDHLGQIMERLHLPKFQTVELEFLTEWVDVMHPMAIALDKLQGDMNREAHLGAVLPTIMVLLQTLQGFVHEHTKPLVTALIAGISKRFPNICNFNVAMTEGKLYILAAVSHPYFKLRWIKSASDRERAREIFLQELEKLAAAESPSETETTLVPKAESSTSFDKFFGFQDMETISATANDMPDQGHQYLTDPIHSLTQLNQYDGVKKLYIKYNTTLPSSAPVERLFSDGGQVLIARRNRLSDKIFETLLILKKNSNIFES